MRGSPRQNSMMVGMPWISKAWATCGFLSTFTFTVRMRPWFSRARRSIVGETILHGPHHSAQKSTSTGISEIRTSSKNDPGSPFTRPALITAKILTAGTPCNSIEESVQSPHVRAAAYPHPGRSPRALPRSQRHRKPESARAVRGSGDAALRPRLRRGRGEMGHHRARARHRLREIPRAALPQEPGNPCRGGMAPRVHPRRCEPWMGHLLRRGAHRADGEGPLRGGRAHRPREGLRAHAAVAEHPRHGGLLREKKVEGCEVRGRGQSWHHREGRRDDWRRDRRADRADDPRYAARGTADRTGGDSRPRMTPPGRAAPCPEPTRGSAGLPVTSPRRIGPHRRAGGFRSARPALLLSEPPLPRRTGCAPLPACPRSTLPHTRRETRPRSRWCPPPARGTPAGDRPRPAPPR